MVTYWRHSTRADSSISSESADINLHATESLIDTILEASSSRVFLSKFWCKHMPPNFGIKVILFQNSYLSVYHAVTVLLRDIRATPNFPGRVLYNVPIVSFPAHSAYLLSPSFSSKFQQPLPPSPKLQPYQIFRPVKLLFKRSSSDSNLLRS